MADRPAGHRSDWGRGVPGQAELVRDIEQIKKDYTPRSVHERAYDEVRGDIKKITENYLTKEDFFREQAKTERKLDMILDILMKKGGTDT